MYVYVCVCMKKRGKKRSTFEAIRVSQDLPNELLLTLVFSSSSLKFSKALIHEYRAKINTNYVLKEREREKKTEEKDP